MKPLVLIALISLAAHSAKPPESKRVTESKGAHVNAKAENTKQEHKTAHATAPAKSKAAIMPENQNSAPDTKKPANQNNENTEIEWKLVTFTRWLVIVGGLQFIALVVQAVVFWYTLRSIKTQTRVSFSALKSNIRAARASVRSSHAASASAEAAQHTVEMMRLDQRAWVGATKVRITDFHPGTTVKVMIRLRNFGKTLALNVTADKYVDPWLNTQRARWSASGANHPNITLFPNGDFWLRAQSEGDISLDEFELIKVGTMGLYVYGMIQYRIMDTDRSMHTSQFSFIYNPECNGFEACEGFTDMD